MSSPSPLVLINGSPQQSGVNASPSSTVTVALANPTGVYAWTIECIGTDDKNTSAAINATIRVNSSNFTATFAQPSNPGASLIFQSIVNNGQDANGLLVSGLQTTFGVYSPLNGIRLSAQNETIEGDAVYGWVSKFNNLANAVINKLYTVSLTSAAISTGDVVALDTNSDPNTITLATPTALANAGMAVGIALGNASPGAQVPVAVGGKVAASVTGLSSGNAGLVTVAAHRASRVPRPTGSGYVLGAADASGNVTVQPVSRGPTSTVQVYNILDFGAVPDSDYNGYKINMSTGAYISPLQTATDNTPAFNAAIAAIQASGVAGVIYIPSVNTHFAPGQTYYYCATQIYITGSTPITICGDEVTGVPYTNNMPNLVFPTVNGLNGDTITEACIKINATSGIIKLRHFQVIQQYSNAVAYWQPHQFSDTNRWIIPTSAHGPTDVIFHCTANSALYTGPSYSDQPNFPTAFDYQRHYPPGSKVYIAFINDSDNPNNHPYRYVCTSGTPGYISSLSVYGFPYAGPAPRFVPGHTYNVGDYVRPTDSNWNGSFYLVTSGSGAVASEPNWASATTKGSYVITSGVQFVNQGQMWPMSPGLSMTLPSDVAGGGSTTWQLDAWDGYTDGYHGLFIDPNPHGTGQITYEVRNPVHGIYCLSSPVIEHVQLAFIQGDAIVIAGAGASQGDSWRVKDVAIYHPARHGLYVYGGDSNIGYAAGVNVLGWGHTAIYDGSFLGNSYRDCHINGFNPPADASASYGQYGYRTSGFVNGSLFESCYQEGGTPPDFLQCGTIVNREGYWSFAPDANLPQVPVFDGKPGTLYASSGPAGEIWGSGQVMWGSGGGEARFSASVPSNGKIYFPSPSQPGVTTTGAIEPDGFTTILDAGHTFIEGQATITSATGTLSTVVTVVTSTKHGFATGYSVVIAGNTASAVNATWTITVVDTVTFTLNGSSGLINTTGTGGTVTNSKGYITWYCYGTASTTVSIGNQSPGQQGNIVTMMFSDIFPTSSSAPYQINLGSNLPYTGMIGLTANASVNNTLVGFDFKNLFTHFLQKVRYGAPWADWTWLYNATTHVDGEFPGSIDWVTDAQVGDPGGRWVTGRLTDSGGTRDHLVHVARLYSDALEEVRAVQVKWDTQNETDGYALATADTFRDGIVTTNATTTTAHTFAIPSGTLTRVAVEVLAKRLDSIGDFAYFVLRGVWYNNAGALTAISAAEVVKSSFAGSASAWTATLATSGANINISVTGEASKVIHWSVVREALEGS